VKSELIGAHLRGVDPALEDDQWNALTAAFDDLPDLDTSAHLDARDSLRIAFLDLEMPAIFVAALERGDDTVSIERWPVDPSRSRIATTVGRRKGGAYGTFRDRTWEFDFGPRGNLAFQSRESAAGLDFNRLQQNEKFARELCRVLGWKIPD
jgi:hypothetical protein